MLDFLLLIFYIALMISLLALLVGVRSGSKRDTQVYYTAENTAGDPDEDTDD